MTHRSSIWTGILVLLATIGADASTTPCWPSYPQPGATFLTRTGIMAILNFVKLSALGAYQNILRMTCVLSYQIAWEKIDLRATAFALNCLYPKEILNWHAFIPVLRTVRFVQVLELRAESV